MNFAGQLLKDSKFLAAAFVTLSASEKAKDPDQPLSCSKEAAAIRRCTEYINQKITEIGCPGIVIGVSVNGQNIWTCGFGYSDLENNVLCKPGTVMRIASISKSITMAAVGKLIEEGKLDLDKPVQHYVPEFPVKKHKEKDVTITTRMLLSHTSGVRHYETKEEMEQDTKKEESEFKLKEYHSMKPYESVTEALNMFKDDVLIYKPGKKFHYTTHGWTLVSAVVEKAADKDFIPYMKNMFLKLGMYDTFPESATDIIYHRARHYVRDKKGRIKNVPYVDNSYKWAGGGFLSSVPDLLKFGNVMLYSWLIPSDTSKWNGCTPGFLKQETVRMMWNPAVTTNKETGDESYGMGWFVYPEIKEVGCGRTRNLEVTHTGGAIGASSVLYVCPHDGARDDAPPHGVVVAVITNLQSVGLTNVARTVAKEFEVFVKQ